MKTFKEYINEHLTDFQQKKVDDMKLDTSEGKKNFKSIIPEGQTHTEIPIQTPLTLKIKDHLNNTPILDKAGQDVGRYKMHPTNPALVVHPDGREVKVTKILKSNPDLLNQYTNIGSKISKGTDGDRTRWTAPALDTNTRKIVISNHPHAIWGKTEGKPWKSCARWGCGHASDHLHDDVEVGGGVAFLTHKDEPTPNNPSMATGRVSIHPYHAVDADGNYLVDKDGNPEHTILRASSKRYGEDDAHESFHKTVAQHLEEKYPMKHPSYKLDENVYQDDEEHNTIHKPMTDVEKKTHVDNFEFNIQNGFTSGDDVRHAVAHNYLTDKHINNIVKTPHSLGAHVDLAEAHRKGDIKMSDEALIKLTSHNNTIVAKDLVQGHREGNRIPDEAINNIAKNPSAIIAHLKLASMTAFPNGKQISGEAITNIIKNTPSTHSDFAAAHRLKKVVLPQESLDILRKAGHNI